MEWEQASKAIVGLGTLIILAFAVVIVVFMVNLKRRLNAKQHLIDRLEGDNSEELQKLKQRVKKLEEIVSELKDE